MIHEAQLCQAVAHLCLIASLLLSPTPPPHSANLLSQIAFSSLTVSCFLQSLTSSSSFSVSLPRC